MTSLFGRWQEIQNDLTPKRTQTDYSQQDEFLYGNVEEATADTEMMLRLEDIGYTRMNASIGKEANDLKPADREAVVRRARLYFQQDAIGSRGIKIYTSYCIGRGLSLKAQDETTQQLADAFWHNPRNNPVFSFHGQQKSSNKLMVEGEIFFFLFPPSKTDESLATGETTVVRRLGDCLEIINIVSNPDDYEEIWYYDRQWTPKGGKMQRRLYPDYRLCQLYPDGLPPLIGTTPAGTPYNLYGAYSIPQTTEVDSYCYIYHLPANSIGERGISFLLTVMAWTKAHKEFLEDRVGINKALARFSWFRKIKGAPSQVRSFASNQPNAGPSDLSRLPWNQPAGGVMTTNQSVDWSPVNAQSGGSSAAAEGKSLRQMACVALGLPEHYIGDGSGTNRATATVMERPVQLTFSDYQMLWKEAYEAMFAFEMTMQNYAWDPKIVDVTAPAILEEDSVAIATAITQLAQAMPEMKVPAFYRRALESLNIEDTQDILPEIEARAKKFEAQMQAQGVSAYGQRTMSTSGRTPEKPGPATNGVVKNAN